MIEFKASSQLRFPLIGMKACTLICIHFINMIVEMPQAKKSLFYPENQAEAQALYSSDRDLVQDYGTSVDKWRKEIMNTAIKLGVGSRKLTSFFKRAGLDDKEVHRLLKKLKLKEVSNQAKGFSVALLSEYNREAASWELVHENEFARLLVVHGHTIAVLHLDEHLWVFDSRDDLLHSSLKVYGESEKEEFMQDLEAKYRLTTAPEIGIYGIARAHEEDEEASESDQEKPS